MNLIAVLNETCEEICNVEIGRRLAVCVRGQSGIDKSSNMYKDSIEKDHSTVNHQVKDF